MHSTTGILLAALLTAGTSSTAFADAGPPASSDAQTQTHPASTRDEPYDEEIVEEEEVHTHRHSGTWAGIQTGLVFTPFRPDGTLSLGSSKHSANRFTACLNPVDGKHCGSLRGFDLRIQVFRSHDAWHYPRWMVYFRTGYTAGVSEYEPAESGGFARGDATRLDYITVPLFFGTNFYFIRDFPLRPFAGLGFGFDALRLEYDRHQAGRKQDASARIGFELHAGLEVRISNYVAATAEIMQLWSARRKLSGVPDFTNTGLSVLAGVSIGIPTRSARRDHVHHVRKVRRVRQVHRVPASSTTPPPPEPIAEPILDPIGEPKGEPQSEAPVTKTDPEPANDPPEASAATSEATPAAPPEASASTSEATPVATPIDPTEND